MDELDDILLEQLHNAKRSKKLLKRLRKLYRKPDDYIEKGEVYIENRIKFFESMIQDKSLLFKKPKKKKVKQSDLLSKNPVYEWYRNAIFVTNFGYKMFTDSVSQYMSYFKKDKE